MGIKSDGRCGPTNGPQCSACKAASKMRAGAVINPFVVVRTLLKANPAAAAFENKVGLLPIHVAMEAHTEIEVIELLAAANQASVTAMGWNSLHLLCAASGVSTSRLLEEIAKGPEEVSIADGNGRLPLHLAAASRQQTAVIEALLKHYPEGARVVDVLERLLDQATGKAVAGRRFTMLWQENAPLAPSR